MRFLFVLLLALSVCPAFAQTKLGIAATVNDDIITTRDVEGRMHLAIQGAGIQPDEAMLKNLQKQATEALIDEHIRIQEAERLGVQPTPDEVNESFAKLAAQNNLTVEQFTQVAQKKPGLYDSLRQQLKAQIAWGNVVRKKIRPQVNITENDINTYIAEKEKNPAKVEFQIAEIFLKNTDENKQLAQQIISELNNGKRFSVLARQFSQGLEASKGGMLGWVPDNTLDPVLNDAIQATEVGSITPPVISDRGIHIFLVRDKKDILPANEGSQRLNLRQIVLPIPANVPPEVDAKAFVASKEAKKELTDCNAMDAMIKKINSPLSRDLGQVRIADLPPGAVGAVKDLADNTASDPVRAGDGYVIFMVCGREETTKDSLRDDVANAIGTERLNRLQNRYYRDLRAAAYVDIKQN